MDRNDVSWHGYWPACPTPFHADQSLDLDSFRALLESGTGSGNAGLATTSPPPAWAGFRSLRVAGIERQSATQPAGVTS